MIGSNVSMNPAKHPRERSKAVGSLWCLILALAFVILSHRASAQPVEVPPTWGGDILSRPRSTGDWGGLRDDLGKKGIVLDVDLLLTPQIVMSGGRNTGGDFWGNLDYTLNVDTQKLGLWPGGFFKVEADTGFGSNAFQDAGTIVPVNTAALLPAPDDRTTALTNATLTQFLSPQFGVTVGKLNLLDAGETEFYGNYRTQFMNTAFNFPMTIALLPLSTFGGGVIALPRDDILLSGLVLGPNGTPTSNDVGEAFHGVLILGNGKLTVKPFGLVGHQSLGFTWNNEDRFSLDQDPSNITHLLLNEQFPLLANPGPVLTQILASRFPNLLVPTQPANRESSSWTISYTFDQYFWQPDGDPKHGVGLFFAFGASDGNPDPIQYAYIAGIGGKGVVPGRPDDSFGLGLARTQFSSPFLPFLRQQFNLGLQREDAIEMYYNMAITPWMNLTSDLQIVSSGLNQAISPTTGKLTGIDTAVVAGARIRVRF
jgi:porin